MSNMISNEELADYIWSILEISDREAGGTNINISCDKHGEVYVNYMLNAQDTGKVEMSVSPICTEEQIQSVRDFITHTKFRIVPKVTLKDKIKAILIDIKERFLLAMEVFVWKNLEDWRHS